ncbi:myb-like protein X isoform X1 [Contarinia nasturtii]|uniref:myb-like protein X isoform X1 n=1 Tax=Contarinia nasturtii TaxID=265458 RepID=UPI0012D477F3|nr:myb-like protein X isoform X1 [Contarinia nasturtii]
MSEDHDNDDYDREDLEHVENLLYANIHYNTGYDENQSTASNNGNNDDNTLTELDRSNGSAARRNAKRYWSTNTPNNRAASNFKPFHKEKQSGIYKTGKVTTKDVNESAPDDAKNNENRDGISNAPTTVTPKQFTPYISFLPFNDSTANEEQTQSPSPSPVASTSKQSEPKSTVLNTNNDLIRKNLTVTHINPFSKKGTIEQYKNLLSEDDSIVSVANKTLLNKKRLNPFNPLSRKAKKKKSDTKSVRKNREELKQLAANADVIDVDDADKDDDDVIILPTQKPPLICLDSSDDEESNATNVAEHAFTEPNAVSDNRRKMPRCSSPSSSIQSTDDFIAQNDQRTFGFDTFATLSDEDLCHVSETVENQLTHNKTSESTSSKRTPIPTNNDNAIFTPPKQMQKDKNKAKKSYEVGANSFTAVDVYESESSDMPDSIYAKGTSNKRKKLSDSDSSSVESITIPKSKRLRKRKKSSGSAKESDHKYSDESSSDLPEMDDDTDDDEDEVSNEISYLVRGEALGKVKNSNKKKSTKPNKNTNENRSENDFINKLSSIVRGQDESDNDELESTQETPTETIEARDIVETVLQRRTKKSKKNQTVEAETVAPENEKTNPWEVTDQVGETDDLNLGRIFTDINGESDQVVSDDAKSENTKSDSAQKTTPANESNENVTENETNQNEDDSEVSEFDLESGWNDEMRRFYNDSWGGETFSMRNIRARMQRGYLNWMITNKDKFPGSSYNRGRQYRCLNCQEKGHLAKNCPRPPAKKDLSHVRCGRSS